MADVFGIERVERGRVLGGVMGGISRRTGIDANVLRVTYGVASALSAAFPGILVYVVLWMILPQEHRFQD